MEANVQGERIGVLLKPAMATPTRVRKAMEATANERAVAVTTGIGSYLHYTRDAAAATEAGRRPAYVDYRVSGPCAPARGEQAILYYMPVGMWPCQKCLTDERRVRHCRRDGSALLGSRDRGIPAL